MYLQAPGQALRGVLYLDLRTPLVEAAANLHHAAWAIDEHQRRAGLLDVHQLAFEDRRGKLRQFERVGAAHSAAHVGLLHLHQFVSGLLHQLARRLFGPQRALEVAGVVIGELHGLDARLEMEPSLLYQLAGKG